MYTLDVSSADEAMGQAQVLTEPDCRQDAVVQTTANAGYLPIKKSTI